MPSQIHTITAGILVLLPVSATQADDAVKDELHRLQGRWVVIAAEANGNKYTGKEVGFEELSIENLQLSVKNANRMTKWQFSLDPTKTPKQMDWKSGERSVPIIYELKDGKLRLALPPSKNKDKAERPEHYDSSKAKMLVLIAEREKK